MEILSKNKDILDYFNTAISNSSDNVELEVIFGHHPASNPINKLIFKNILDKLKIDLGDPQSVSTNLDIKTKAGDYPSNTRCTILDLDSIKTYCITNSLEKIPESSIVFIQKRPDKDDVIQNNRIVNKEYNYRINIKSEVDLNYNSDQIKRYDQSSKLKHFRYKKRYSFITNDKLFRIDLSVVKSTQWDKVRKTYKYAKTFKEANILNNPEEYELEIEYIGSTDKKENGVFYINDYYNKLMSDIDDPSMLSGSVSNPLTLDIKLSDTGSTSEELGLTTPILDLPGKSKEIIDKIKGKNIKIKETYDLGETNILEDDILTIINYNSDYKKDGRYVLLNISSSNKQIWVPLTQIYSEHFDIDDLILGIYSSEKYGGGKSTEEGKQLSFKEDKLEILSDKCVELLNDHIKYLLEIIHNNKLILSLSNIDYVLNRYSILTKQNDKKSKYKKPRFIGPQPITLNHENLLQSNDINILKGYAVTEKADGIRCLLFITENTGYLITSKMEIISTGLKFPKIDGEWLLDGEYINKDKDGADLDNNLYMVFDIYYSNTNPVYKYIWTSFDDTEKSRLNELNRFKELIQYQIKSDIYNIRIGIKDYEYGSVDLKDETQIKEIFKKCKTVLDKDYGYYIDGLILMPIYLGVKGDKLNPSPDYIGGKWEYNFKWKPPEENTIDFKVSTVKISSDSKQDKIFPFEDENGILQKYKKLNIINGYNEEEDMSLEFYMKILTGDKPSKERTQIFNPPDTKEYVGITNILLEDNKMLCLKTGEEIRDGDIVEMRYNSEGLNNMIWEPLRLRNDKTEPNYKSVADNVWKTISIPITSDFIRGLKPYNVKKIEKNVKKSVDTGYYVSNNRTLETNVLAKYHNYIKTSLINGICSTFNKGIQYMDLSCGRGGDVERYIKSENNIKFILGLDIEDINEASRRYFYKQATNKAVFLQYDTSKNIKSKEQPDINKHSKVMIDILYGTAKSVPVQYKQIYNDYKKITKGKGGTGTFQVISSQFTLHYYLRSEETFNGFLTNVEENIDKGGYFIATFYNGNKLFDLLKDKDGIEYTNKSGDKVYEIKKKYDLENFNYDSEDTSNMFGNTISVYMDSIGQEIDEYLVNMNFLIDSFKQRGMELVTPNSKSNIFNKSNFDTEGVGSFEKMINNLKTLSKQDKLLSKGGMYKDALRITDNEKLKLLSGLNVYVIFQKK